VRAALRGSSNGLGQFNSWKAPLPLPLPKWCDCPHPPSPALPSDAGAPPRWSTLTFGAALVGLGRADVMVGARPSERGHDPAPCGRGRGARITTGFQARRSHSGRRRAHFTDCAVVPERPGAAADSAMAAARDRAGSWATSRSSRSFPTARRQRAGPRVTRAQRREPRAAAPDFAFDGELPNRAALVASVAARKAPDRARRARNVLVFPDLDSATSVTNWCSAWAVGRRSGRSSRLARPSPTCRGPTADDIVTRWRSRSFNGERS